jgi:hypothetical protein
MKPVITSVVNVYPEFAHIQWTVEDPNGLAGNIQVLRSTSSEGPFEEMATLPPSSFFYRDLDPGAKDGFSHKLFYMVRVESNKTPGEYVFSDPYMFNDRNIYLTNPHRERLVRVARKNLRITLERLNGTPFLLLKRKLFGEKCKTCYNPLTQDVMLSRCGECFGTTNLGGYCDPIRVWVKLDPESISQTFGIGGSASSNVIGGVMLDYPKVDSGDILVDCYKNTRYSIVKVNNTTSSGVLVHQEIQLSELTRFDIAYSIPVSLS